MFMKDLNLVWLIAHGAHRLYNGSTQLVCTKTMKPISCLTVTRTVVGNGVRGRRFESVRHFYCTPCRGGAFNDLPAPGTPVGIHELREFRSIAVMAQENMAPLEEAHAKR